MTAISKKVRTMAAPMGGARLTALACALAWVTGHAETPPGFVGRSVDPLIDSFDRDGYVVR